MCDTITLQTIPHPSVEAKRADAVLPALPSFTLGIQRGPSAGHTFAFAQPRVSLGRAPGCDVVLSSSRRRVSRHHAEIRWSGGLYWLIDLGSINTTLLNEYPLQAGTRYSLHPGDRITVGEFRLEFVACEGSTPRKATAPRPC